MTYIVLELTSSGRHRVLHFPALPAACRFVSCRRRVESRRPHRTRGARSGEAKFALREHKWVTSKQNCCHSQGHVLREQRTREFPDARATTGAVLWGRVRGAILGQDHPNGPQNKAAGLGKGPVTESWDYSPVGAVQSTYEPGGHRPGWQVPPAVRGAQDGIKGSHWCFHFPFSRKYI